MLLKKHGVSAQIHYTNYVYMKNLERVLNMPRKHEISKLFAV